MRVLVVPEQFPADPADVAGIFTVDYVTAIARHCDVTVLLPGRAGRHGLVRSERDGIEYLTWTPRLRGGDRLRRLRHVETLVGLGRLDRALGDVDVVHAHGPVLYGVAGRTLGRKLGVPVLVTVHTNPFARVLRRAAMRRLATRTLESVDCVCPVSRELQRQIEAAGIVPKRFEVTYNPVDTDLFRPASGERRRRLLFAGRLEEYKGAMRTLRAFAAVAEHLPDWTLTIAGDGPERQPLESFLREHRNLAGRVELFGAYTKPQLAELLAESSGFVAPSRHESFGIVLAEAMAAGVPVIGPNRTAPPEFVDEGCGLLVDPDDEDAIAGALLQLVTTLPSYRPDVIRARVVERFGFDAFGARLLALYEDLRGGRRACAASPA